MYSNYTEETKPLFKLLRVQAFRFILVRFNHYALVEQLKKDIQQHCPGRPIAEADAATMSYRQLTDAYYALGKGIFIIHNFEQVLSNPELYTGLNLRRDKLAQYPIAMICLISPAADKLYARQLMEKMPDLWSFRSLVLTLEEEIPAAENALRYTVPESPLRTTTLGGVGREEKQQELARLLQLIDQTAPEDKALLAARYEQIKDIQTDLGLYEEAIATIDKLLLLAADDADDYARLLIDMGDVYNRKGLYYQALDFYKEAEKKVKAATANPNNGNLAVVMERVGNIFEILGDWDNALIYFEEYKRLSKNLIEANPDNPNYQFNLALSYEKIGSIYDSIGQTSKALKHFEHYLQLSRELNDNYPNNISFKNGLSIAYGTLGDICETMGQLDEALKHFIQRTNIAKQLFNDYPNNDSFKNGLANSYDKLGTIYTTMGQMDNALKFLEDCHKLSLQLHNDHPYNINFKNGLAVSYAKLGNIYMKNGSLNEALKYYETNLKLSLQLHNDYPSSVLLKSNLAIAYEKLGSLYRTMGQMDEALKHFEKDLKLSQQLHNIYPESVSFKNSLIIANNRIGSLCLIQEDPTKALNYFLKAKSLASQLVEQTNGMNADFLFVASATFYSIGITYEMLGQVESNNKADNLKLVLPYFTESLNILQQLEAKGITGGRYTRLKNDILGQLNSLQSQ